MELGIGRLCYSCAWRRTLLCAGYEYGEKDGGKKPWLFMRRRPAGSLGSEMQPTGCVRGRSGERTFTNQFESGKKKAKSNAEKEVRFPCP